MDLLETKFQLKWIPFQSSKGNISQRLVEIQTNTHLISKLEHIKKIKNWASTKGFGTYHIGQLRICAVLSEPWLLTYTKVWKRKNQIKTWNSSPTLAVDACLTLPASGDFCHLLITFTNSLDPD